MRIFVFMVGVLISCSIVGTLLMLSVNSEPRPGTVAIGQQEHYNITLVAGNSWPFQSEALPGNYTIASGRGSSKPGGGYFPAGDIIVVGDGGEVMRFSSGGAVIVHGKMVADDREVYRMFRDWLRNATTKQAK